MLLPDLTQLVGQVGIDDKTARRYIRLFDNCSSFSCKLSPHRDQRPQYASDNDLDFIADTGRMDGRGSPIGRFAPSAWL